MPGGDTHTHLNHPTRMGLPVPREKETKQKGMTRRSTTIFAPPHIILPNLNIFSQSNIHLTIDDIFNNKLSKLICWWT